MQSSKDLIALTIWWCEGTKIRKDRRGKSTYYYSIEVTNSDPRMIKLFVDFLVTRIGIPKQLLKGQLHIHIGNDIEYFERYWSREIGIPLTQFNKTMVKKKGQREKRNKGTFKLRAYGKKYFLKLQKLVEEELLPFIL